MDKQHGTIADIQFLRAVAVLMVMAHHAQALFPNVSLTLFQQGLWAGVDLFFCISGYVITRSLLPALPLHKDFASCLQCCLSFWQARFWRIIPAMITGLCFMLLTVWCLYPEGFVATCYDALAALLQVANLHFYQCAVNHAVTCGNGAIYWSLSLEFQFYLLLPIFLLLCPKRWIAPTLLTAFIIQIAIPHTHWHSILSFIRTESFIIGVGIALFHQKTEAKLAEPLFLRMAWRRYAITLLLVCSLCFSGNQNIQLIPNPIALTALLSGVLVFIAAYSKDYLLPDSIIKRIFVWGGNRSYSLYLLHICTFNWVQYGMSHSGLASSSLTYRIIALVSATVLLAALTELNYRFVEKRFHRTIR